MGQESHRKYKEYKKAKNKLKSYSSDEDREQVFNKRIDYKLQEKEDDREYERTNRLFDSINGRD